MKPWKHTKKTAFGFCFKLAKTRCQCFPQCLSKLSGTAKAWKSKPLQYSKNWSKCLNFAFQTVRTAVWVSGFYLGSFHKWHSCTRPSWSAHCCLCQSHSTGAGHYHTRVSAAPPWSNASAPLQTQSRHCCCLFYPQWCCRDRKTTWGLKRNKKRISNQKHWVGVSLLQRRTNNIVSFGWQPRHCSVKLNKRGTCQCPGKTTQDLLVKLKS